VRSNAQIISQFTFDADPVTAADVGPDATAISTSAFSGAGGVGGTNGLNAGLPKLNINMVVPTDATFDTPGIDVSFDSHREENAGTFWQRGNSLRIIGCANLSVSYRVDDGGGGFNTVNSGNVFAIPNDDIYRNYRFYYTDCDGVGELLVDGVSVWSNDGPDNRPMYWTGSGNVTVGNGVDATGSNKTFFDNLVVGAITCSPLPVELTTFSAKFVEDERKVDLNWTTASEINSDYFLLEKSKNGEDWSLVSKIQAAGNSSVQLNYYYQDANPYSGTSYYRLKQIDFDQSFKYSPAAKVDNYNATEVQVFPNPQSRGQEVVVSFPAGFKDEITLVLRSTDGKVVLQKVYEIKEGEQIFMPVPNDVAPGMYILGCEHFTKKLIVK
jgi:hypothetical protein